MIESTVTIAQADLSDIPHLEKLVHEAYRDPSSSLGWTTEAHLVTGARVNETGLAEMLKKNGAKILKATTSAGVLAGCVYLEKQESDLYLGLITVAPRIQAQGIGKQILAAAEEEAVRAGCQRVTMGVISIRYELIAWYERRGYQRTGITRPLPVDRHLVISDKPFVLMEMAKSMTADR